MRLLPLALLVSRRLPVLTRGLTLSTSEEDYVLAARALGASNWRIMISHILPNIAAAIIVTVSLDIGGIILAEATLSFLGLGIQPPNPSWGSMVAVGNRYLQTRALDFSCAGHGYLPDGYEHQSAGRWLARCAGSLFAESIEPGRIRRIGFLASLTGHAGDSKISH